MDEVALPRSRQALLLIDFINPLDFPQEDALAPSVLEAGREASRLAHAARERGVPVICANDNFGPRAGRQLMKCDIRPMGITALARQPVTRAHVLPKELAADSTRSSQSLQHMQEQ